MANLESESKQLTALITGGTSGIGAAFADELASRGMNLVLVARNEESLKAKADSLEKKYGVEVETLVADLHERSAQAKVGRRLQAGTKGAEHSEYENHRPISIFVNNAGFSVRSDVVGEDISLHDAAFEVMVRAVFFLSNQAARAFMEHKFGYIINVNSVSAYLPQNNYSAIKAWGSNFTQSLAVRLNGTGVRVISLEPGWVRTEFHQRAGIKGSSIPSFLWLKPQTVVQQCLKDAAEGKTISIPTKRFKVLAFLSRVAPRNILLKVSAWLTARRNNEK